MSYDLFISYARVDNKENRITSLVDQIGAEFQNFAGRELDVFFDVQDIEGGDDWRHKILDGLRESKMMLAVLSPGYLKSVYCQWEYNDFRRHEVSRGMLNEGLAPVYFVEIPEFSEKEYENKLEEWCLEVLRLNYYDLRRWYDQGETALRENEIKQQLSNLSEKLSKKIKEGEVRNRMLGNVDRHNPAFMGRSIELRQLREELSKKVVGILTAVHGIGGIGKTALAIEYAHVFSHEYGGGCWQMGCEGKDNLQQVIAELYLPLGVEFDEEEKRDIHKRFQKVMAKLRSLCDQHEPHRCLIILDNIDIPELLSPFQTKVLPSADWMQIIATSRLGEAELHGVQKDRKFIAVDELPEEDAVALIEIHQPFQKFSSDTDRVSAMEIVKLLGGFTLAIEVAAVYMGELAEDISFSDFLSRLKRDGMEGLDTASGLIDSGVMHGEKSLTITLRPTLEKLKPEELLALSFASLLPADQIAVSWLRTMVSKEFSAIGEDAEIGLRDPWTQVLGKLLSLRLLRVAGTNEKGKKVNIARMHRVVGEVLRDRFKDQLDSRLDLLVEHALERSEYLEEHWQNPEDRWEVEPLVNFTDQLLDNAHPKAAQLTLWLGQWYSFLYKLDHFKSLHWKAIQLNESCKNELENAKFFSNLGVIQIMEGNFNNAKDMIRKALEIDERLRKPNHEFLAIRYSNLASVERALGNLAESKQLHQKAFEIRVKTLPADHTYLADSYSNLATVERDLNNLEEAKRLNGKAIKIREKKLPSDHPDLALSYSNLAGVEQALGNLVESKKLHQKAFKIREKKLPSDHPYLASSYNSLAGVEQALGNLVESKRLYHKAIEIREKKLPPDHPDLADSYFSFGQLLCDMKEYEEAKGIILKCINIRKKILSNDHELARTYNQLSSILVRMKEWNEALQASLESMRISPQFPNPVYWLAKAYEGRNLEGDKIREIEAWKKYLEIGPSTEERRTEAEEKLKLLG